MAGTKSNYLEDEILDHILSAATWTAPATTYIGLWTAALSDTSTGATAGEVSGGSYARVALTNNATNWPASSAGAKSNGIAIDFGTASANWGTVTHFCIVDSASGAGNILYHGDLTASKVINNGDSAQFPIGDLDVSEG
jgi:hypothetical protein